MDNLNTPAPSAILRGRRANDLIQFHDFNSIKPWEMLRRHIGPAELFALNVRLVRPHCRGQLRSIIAGVCEFRLFDQIPIGPRMGWMCPRKGVSGCAIVRLNCDKVVPFFLVGCIMCWSRSTVVVYIIQFSLICCHCVVEQLCFKYYI